MTTRRQFLTGLGAGVVLATTAPVRRVFDMGASVREPVWWGDELPTYRGQALGVYNANGNGPRLIRNKEEADALYGEGSPISHHFADRPSQSIGAQAKRLRDDLDDRLREWKLEGYVSTDFREHYRVERDPNNDRGIIETITLPNRFVGLAGAITIKT